MHPLGLIFGVESESFPQGFPQGCGKLSKLKVKLQVFILQALTDIFRCQNGPETSTMRDSKQEKSTGSIEIFFDLAKGQLLLEFCRDVNSENSGKERF